MKRIGVLGLIVLGSLLGSSAAVAGPDAFDVTAFYGYRVGGELSNVNQGSTFVGDLSVDNGDAWGVAFDVIFFDKALQFSYGQQDTSLRLDEFGVGESRLVGLKIENYQFGGSFMFGDIDENIQPYMTFFLGWSRLKPETSSSRNQFNLGFAGGAKFYLNDRFGLRLESRWTSTYISSSSNYWCDPFFCYSIPSNNYLNQIEFNGGVVVRF